MVRHKVLYLNLVFILVALLFKPKTPLAQDSGGLGDFSATGYVKYMNTIMIPPDYTYALTDIPEDTWLNESMFHNRIDFRWSPASNLETGMSMRNRFIYGDLVESFPNYDNMISKDYGYLHKLTKNVIEEDSYVFNSSIDRLWVNLRQGKFEARIGRQRINWGQAYVWNPNDIFNAYSFFDFDYEEKPGSDAIRLMYYPSFTSAAELAVKMNRNEEVTAAGYYRLNKWGYDWQFLGGVLNENEYVAGMGWSGNIERAGFSGEVTYLLPEEHFRNTSGIWLVSGSAGYRFSNSLYLQFEAYYNGNYNYMDLSSFTNYYYRPLTVKTLSFSEFSWFGQVSYPIHPLLNGTLAVMHFPDIEGYFVNPSLRYSLTNNVQISAFAQFFQGKFIQNVTEEINFIFFRFKWSF